MFRVGVPKKVGDVMAWTNDPKIRDLEAYAKKHGYAMVVMYGVERSGKRYGVATYGLTLPLCRAAGVAGDLLCDLVNKGDWPNWPDHMPYTTGLEERENEIRRLRALVEELGGTF